MTRRSLRNAAGVAVALCVAVSLFGCTASSTPPPPDPTEAQITAGMLVFVAEQAYLGSEKNPDVWANIHFERFIEPDEMEATVGVCIRDLGVTSVVFEDFGGMTWTEDGDGEYTSAVVTACSLKYPTEDRAMSVRTDAQLDYLYNYVTGFVVPCVWGEGFESDPPPTREEFVANFHRDLFAWSPYESINYQGAMWPSYDSDAEAYDLRATTLMERCPYLPEGF